MNLLLWSLYLRRFLRKIRAMVSLLLSACVALLTEIDFSARLSLIMQIIVNKYKNCEAPLLKPCAVRGTSYSWVLPDFKGMRYCFSQI